MEFLIVIIIIVIGLYGLKVMDRLDSLMATSSFKEDKNEYKQKVLIYSNSNYLPSVEELLIKNDIYYKLMDNQFFNIDEKYDSFDRILALSNDDFENVMMCVTANRYYNIKKSIAFCNDVKNNSIYNKYVIDNICVDGMTERQILSYIEEKLKHV